MSTQIHINEKNGIGAMVLSRKGSERSSFAPVEPIRLNYSLKLDLRLIPILGFTYTILFLDRSNSKIFLLC